MAQATAQQIYARWALFGMKSWRDSLLDKRGEFRTPLVQVFRSTKAGALYAIIVFPIGSIFGTIRVLLLVLHLGETIAVVIEAPMILLDQVTSYGSSAGAIGLAAQMTLAIFPVIQVWRR